MSAQKSPLILLLSAALLAVPVFASAADDAPKKDDQATSDSASASQDEAAPDQKADQKSDEKADQKGPKNSQVVMRPDARMSIPGQVRMGTVTKWDPKTKTFTLQPIAKDEPVTITIDDKTALRGEIAVGKIVRTRYDVKDGKNVALNAFVIERRISRDEAGRSEAPAPQK